MPSGSIPGCAVRARRLIVRRFPFSHGDSSVVDRRAAEAVNVAAAGRLLGCAL
jgi:hypothetical protein